MKFVIAFYRTRKTDDAYAVIGRETLDAIDLVSAIEITHQLSKTLNMPQKPDALSLGDPDGNRLYTGEIRAGTPDERLKPMNIHAEHKRQVLRVEVWENEGGASATDALDHQYGRRIERDRTWTVYHVFTGVPARINGCTLTDLTISDATDGMLTLNRRNARRRNERNRCQS
ncbi:MULTISPECIES: hypothetical protein [unclassified Shinella]|uniref:hypothetical protein n=1 Tax=unclassified Shinella TaxID=2643062 RepID=UPI00225D8C42|nr:hypothetical protein SHINE37_41109 [Rhizobiaceae bacterium]CAK7255757.1 protein of unknown function [Shinella sp. WSC3-e]